MAKGKAAEKTILHHELMLAEGNQAKKKLVYYTFYAKFGDPTWPKGRCFATPTLGFMIFQPQSLSLPERFQPHVQFLPSGFTVSRCHTEGIQKI